MAAVTMPVADFRSRFSDLEVHEGEPGCFSFHALADSRLVISPRHRVVGQQPRLTPREEQLTVGVYYIPVEFIAMAMDRIEAIPRPVSCTIEVDESHLTVTCRCGMCDRDHPILLIGFSQMGSDPLPVSRN